MKQSFLDELALHTLMKTRLIIISVILKQGCTNTAKSLVWLLRMNKLKTKYNDMALCKPENLSLSTALLAIY
jgi:hypothetical protein